MKCSNCGHEADPGSGAGSNSRRMVSFEVPEEFLPILKRSLLEKSTQAGMWGMGSLANSLGRFSRSLSPEIPNWMDGFEASDWARTLDAHDNGWTIVCVIDPDNERRIAIVGYSPDETRELVLATRSPRKNDDIVGCLRSLEDFFERRMPVPPEQESGPAAPV